MKTQKQLKDLKKSIIIETALQIGYHPAILQNLPNYALIEASRKIALNNLITPQTGDADIQNILITEAVKVLNFQDFKEIAKFFFQSN